MGTIEGNEGIEYVFAFWLFALMSLVATQQIIWSITLVFV